MLRVPTLMFLLLLTGSAYAEFDKISFARQCKKFLAAHDEKTVTMTALIRLAIKGTKIPTDRHCELLAERAEKIEKIVLLGQRVTDITPLTLFTNLKTLDLNCAYAGEGLDPVTGKEIAYINWVEDISPLKDLPKLSSLTLDNCKIKNFRLVGEMASLEQLSALAIRLESFEDIRESKTVRSLRASKNPLGQLNGIESFSSLKTLELESLAAEKVDIGALAKLSQLESLTLKNNSVIDFSALSSLAMLRRLNLSNTHARKALSLAKLTRLEFLDLSRNRLEDVQGLGSLVSLKELSLDENPLGAEKYADLSPLSHLSSLETLSLWKVGYFDCQPLAKLTNLKILSMGLSNISNTKVLGALSALRRLSMGKTKEDISFLPKLTALEVFMSSENGIEEVPDLTPLTSLTFLVLTHNRIRSVDNVAKAKRLTLLDLTDNRIADVRPLAGLTLMKRLFLGENEIIDCDPLMSLRSLESLELHKNRLKEPEAEVRKKFAFVKKLTL